MTHFSHLFFTLIPVFILFGTVWSILEISSDRVYTYRQQRKQTIQCWIAGIVGIAMAAPFVIISIIAFT